MQSITIQVPDEVATNLAAEASLRKLTIEEVAKERLISPASLRRDRPVRGAKKAKTNYLQLADEASKSPSARKSSAEIDADTDASRDEW